MYTLLKLCFNEKFYYVKLIILPIYNLITQNVSIFYIHHKTKYIFKNI